MSAENDDAIKKLQAGFGALVGDGPQEKSKAAADSAAAVEILAQRKAPDEKAAAERVETERQREVIDIDKSHIPHINGLLARLEEVREGGLPNADEKKAGNDTPGKLFSALVADVEKNLTAVEALVKSEELKGSSEKENLERLLAVLREEFADFEKNPVIDAPPAPAGPDFNEVFKNLPQANDHALVPGVMASLEGRGVDDYFGLGEVAAAIGKKAKIAERILKAVIKAGLVEQKQGMNEFRKKQAAAAAPAPVVPPAPAAPPAAPVMPTGAPPTPPAAPPAPKPAPPAAPPPPKPAFPSPAPAAAPATPTGAPATPTGAPKPLTGAPAAPTGAPVIKTPDRRAIIDLSLKFNQAGGRVVRLFEKDEKSGLSPDETRELFGSLQEFLDNAKQQMESGLAIEPAARKAHEDLTKILESGAIDNQQRVRDLMNQLYNSLEQSFRKHKFKIELPKTAATPAAPAAPAVAEKPLEIGLKEDGNFDVTMAEAFANDVFYDFFKKFDAERNPSEAFDATNPNHEERFEKAVEAYRLWREAIDVFSGRAAHVIQQDMGLRPDAKELKLLEADLLQLILKDTQKVRDMIDLAEKFDAFEEAEARKENEIRDLGGLGKLTIQLDELDKMRMQKKLQIEAQTQALRDLAKQRSIAAQAGIIEKRSFLAAIDDRIRGVRSAGSFDELATGLLKGKEKAALDDVLTKNYSGMEINEAAAAYPEMRKLTERAQAQVESAIREYEKIEQRYLQVKSTISTVEQAMEQKEQIAGQFQQLRLTLFANIGSFREVARLTAGRARDTIKGLVDVDSPAKLPAAAKTAEESLASLRRAADYRFGRDRYGSVPEIVGSILDDEGQIITEADEALSAKVREDLQRAVKEFSFVKGASEAIMKVFFGFGERGREVGEQVLVDAIKESKSKSDERRADFLQALLFQLRAAAL